MDVDVDDVGVDDDMDNVDDDDDHDDDDGDDDDECGARVVRSLSVDSCDVVSCSISLNLTLSLSLSLSLSTRNQPDQPTNRVDHKKTARLSTTTPP
jgi:hypothetical protein